MLLFYIPSSNAKEETATMRRSAKYDKPSIDCRYLPVTPSPHHCLASPLLPPPPALLLLFLRIRNVKYDARSAPVRNRTKGKFFMTWWISYFLLFFRFGWPSTTGLLCRRFLLLDSADAVTTDSAVTTAASSVWASMRAFH